MGNVVRFPTGPPSKFGFQRVQATYTVGEISQQFGLSERDIRRWTREGLVRVVPGSGEAEPQYDFRSLTTFRYVRELRGKGLSLKQIDAELRGQLNLFQEPEGQLIRLPLKRTLFEEALQLHEQKDRRAVEAYRQAIEAGDCVADAYCNLGILEYESGKVTDAFDHFTSSLRHDPRHFESHFNLGNLYFESGDLRLARLHYEISGEIEPSFPNLYFNLGLVHAMAGDFAAAISTLDRYKSGVSHSEAEVIDDLLASLKKAVASGIRP